MAKTFLVNASSLGAARGFIALSQVLVLPVVARFLEPADFGDMALAMSVVVFTQILSDAGMGRSLIRKKHYNPAEWNSVFWLMSAVGVGLMLVLLAVAPGWAAVFDRPALLWLLIALSVLPMLSALSAVALAQMEKDGQFPQIAVIRTTAGVAGLVTVLGLAIAGAGVWALVAQQVVIALIQTVAANLRSQFKPSAPRNFTPLHEHIRFATDNIGVSMLFTAQRQAPIVLLNTFLGAPALGLFAMAERFLSLPRVAVAGPVSQVVFVRIAKVQHDLSEVAALYHASCRILAFVVFPPVAVLAGSGASLFPLFLSETWAPVALVFALAGPGVAIDVVTSSGGVLLQAMDQTRLRLRMIAEKTVLRTLAVAVAAPFGLEAAALAMTLFSLAYLPRYLSFLQRVTPVSLSHVLKALSLPGLLSAIAWGAVVWSEGQVSPLQILGLAGIALLLTWGLAFLFQKKTLRAELSLLDT